MTDDPNTAAVAEAAATFCEEYDDGDVVLETVLAVDADHDTWTFDDVALNSGTFGELVSRGIVEKVDGEYHVASRQGVLAGLEGESVSVLEESGAGESGRELSSPFAFDVQTAVALVGALAFLFAMRMLNYRSVFRSEYVVSPANDPYYYRYWLEELLAESEGATDLGVVANMPDGAAGARPLTHATNWFVAELLGGDQWAADMVAAWLPVVATVALGIVVYWLAVILTRDVRVGIASVLVLAITPVHAVYTGAGFLEHRLHQYFWLGVTLLTLGWLAVDLQRQQAVASSAGAAVRGHLRRPWTWIASIALGFALAFSVHAWGGSVLLLVPVGMYLGVKTAIDARAGLSPTLANLPLVVGLAVGGALTAALHVRLGWHETFVAAIAVLAVGAGVVVVGLGELWRRLEWPTGGLVALEGVVAVLGVLAFRQLRSADWARLRERADDLFFRQHHGATEIDSLFALEQGIVFGPMIQIGITFYIALAVLGWAGLVASRRYEPGWSLLTVYGVFWLAMAAFQGRFAAQLAISLAVLGGMGLVWLLAWLDLARVPKPFEDGDAEASAERAPRGAVADGGERRPLVVPREPKTLFALFWVGLLICGMSLFFVSSLSAQTAYSDAQFEAAMAIDDHAAEMDREYPENFVLSEWSHNRMYNYFVNGESRSYGYAASTFTDFLIDDDPDGWYEEFDDSDVGYVVTTDVDEAPAGSAQAQLHENLGTGGLEGESDPLEHYQVIYVGRDATAFAVVPGATFEDTGEAGETVPVETEVTVSGETFTYARTATVDEDGELAVTVPYPGEYTVGDQTVEVSAAAVENGSTITLE